MIAVLALALAVDAQPASLSPQSLRFTAPAKCLSETELYRRVNASLHEPIPETRVLRGEVLPEPWGHLVTFTIFEGDEEVGRRVFELTGDCRKADETLVLVATMLLEGEADENGAAKPTPPEKPSEAKAVPPQPLAVEEDGIPERPEEERLPFSLFGGVGLEVGMTPAAGMHLFLGMDGRVGDFSFGAAGVGFFPSQASSSSAGNVEIVGVGGRGELCFWPFRGGVTLGSCAMAGVVWLRGRGKDFETNRGRTVALGEVGGTISLTGHFSRSFGWRTHFGALASPTVYDFTDDFGEVLFGQWPLRPFLELGILYAF